MGQASRGHEGILIGKKIKPAYRTGFNQHRSRQIKLAHGSVTRLDFVTRITAAIRLFA
jgi:hypothetical protein